MLQDSSKLLYVLLGTSLPNGGMFEYWKATIDEALKSNKDVAIAATEEVCSAIDADVEQYIIRDGRCNPFNNRKLILSRELCKRYLGELTTCIARAIESYKPEVVHFTNITLYSDYIFKILAADKDNVTFLQTLHDPGFHDEKVSPPLALLRRLQYKRLINLFSSSDRLVFHIHDRRLLLGTEFPDNALFFEKQHPLPKCQAVRKREIMADKIRLGFLGRIEEYKGIEDLYEALLLAIRDNPGLEEKFEVVIIGKGEIDRDKWLSLPCPVRIENSYISDAVFHQEMADLDLLVLPYRAATQSGVLAMAVSYGIPVVATNVGAMDHFVCNGKNGFLIEPQNPINLANVLNNVLTDSKLLATIGRAGNDSQSRNVA